MLATYTWSTGTDMPDGTAFTEFLDQLNNCGSSDGTTISGGFAGHCDWRLPSIVELQGIVDATQGICGGGSGACIDSAFGPTQATLTDTSSTYWSATPGAGNPILAWGARFGGGSVLTGLKTLSLYVRAVRGGL